MSESKIVGVQSDAGTYVAYDPALLRERIKAPSSWWKGKVLQTPERLDGRLAAWPLGSARASARSYRARLTDALHPQEEPFAVGSSEPVPLVVESDELFLGPVERLPGDGAGDRLAGLPDGGSVYPWTAGRYVATVHVLDWKHEERFWNEDNEPTADAPPDFVVVVVPAEGDLPSPPEAPRPLLDYFPRKTPLASKKVTKATRPRPKDPEEKPKRRSTRKKTKKTVSSLEKRQAKIVVRAAKPGELGVGATVRHAVYGIGEVRFMRDGFPKVRVVFPHRGEQKVDKSELTVL